MPKRKKPEEKPEEQFKRFVETARKHDVDESGSPLESAFKKVNKRHQAPPHQKSGGKDAS